MTTMGSVLEILGNTWLGHAWCWLRGLGVQSPRPSQSSGLEVCRTRTAMVGRWIKVTIKNDEWAVAHFWVMEQKAEPVTTGSPSEWTIECIRYEYLQSVCKMKYFITCTKVVYIGAGMFVKMYQFWILSSPPPICLQLLSVRRSGSVQSFGLQNGQPATEPWFLVAHFGGNRNWTDRTSLNRFGCGCLTSFNRFQNQPVETSWNWSEPVFLYR